MFNKFTTLLSLVLLAITSAYAASPEQLNSVPASPNFVQTTTDEANKEDANAQRDLNYLQSRIDKANKGDPNAQFELGEIYSKGDGVPQDYNEAFKWYTMAAEQRYAAAQNMLGQMYYSGDGVPQDYNEAIKWYTMAAEQRHTEAQFKLGEIYSKGDGVPQDYNEAFEWFTKAAKKEHPIAQVRLALMYYEGKGVIDDYVEAYKWTLLAGRNGEDVTKIKQDLTAQMTPDQIAEAQKLAKDFVAKKKNPNNSGTTKPNLPVDKTKDATDATIKERLLDKIQKMEDAIELDEKGIESLPLIRCPPWLHRGGAHGIGEEDANRMPRTKEELVPRTKEELIEALQIAIKTWKLLADQKINYMKVLPSVEKYHNLVVDEVDVMDMKKRLIECQGRMEEMDRVKECLRKELKPEKIEAPSQGPRHIEPVPAQRQSGPK